MLYDQGHYKMTYRKAKKLLDQPDYDYSVLPLYYKSIAQFQLAQNPKWFRRHPKALTEAENDLLLVFNNPSWTALYKAHLFEIKALKMDLYAFGEVLAVNGKSKDAEDLRKVLLTVFGTIPNFEEDVVNPIAVSRTNYASDSRETLSKEAKKHVGVPYKWAGVSPKGFDCSGFTSYVFLTQNVTLPRRAADQYKEGTRVRKNNVQAGDLIFFNNGKELVMLE